MLLIGAATGAHVPPAETGHGHDLHLRRHGAIRHALTGKPQTEDQGQCENTETADKRAKHARST